ncbi:MAG TPA: DNA cytosine methyltransferase [Candidatus Saccharimonadales bacterium]|nr:DNA cytosine methyltransferase [Candidatus Saccharimonadales bacterium]
MRTRKPTIGSLCTGYGGLDMAVRAVFSGKLAWCADNDKHVATILATRYPGVPNLGDITTLDWGQALPVDIMCAGFPCQDISTSGKGLGIEKGERSGIWKNIAEGIRLLRPSLIIVENVSAIRRRGLDRVLGDLAENGYYSVWTSLRASDIGAAHRRERVFILAYRPRAEHLLLAAYTRCQRRRRWTTTRQAQSWRSPGGPLRPGAGAVAPESMGQQERSITSCPGRPTDEHSVTSLSDIVWGRYEAAIRGWEAVSGRAAPHPTELGTCGQPRLSPVFSEWLMGIPSGFVTNLDLPYSAKHRAIGNGVVPQQAIAALRELVEIAVQEILAADVAAA